MYGVESVEQAGELLVTEKLEVVVHTAHFAVRGGRMDWACCIHLSGETRRRLVLLWLE